jgi:hypothetical protein
MWRSFQVLGVLLLLCGILSPARATTSEYRLTPEKLKASDSDPLSFNIKVDRLRDGNLLFRVTVSTRGQPFRSDAKTCLALEQPDASKADSATTLRDLPADKKATTIACVFVVPETAIGDSELCFQLQNVDNGNGDVYSVSLKDLVDFYKP